MIKKLFLVAALVLPGLAYGADPTADLSVHIVPAGSTGAGVCNNPPIPVPAQAAGYTSLVACWDFTQPGFSDITQWLVCDGSGGWSTPSSPQWWAANWFDANTTHTRCGAFTMISDGGIQVFDIAYTSADVTIDQANGSLGHTIDTCRFDASTCNKTFHNTGFFEITWRSDANTAANASGDPPNCCGAEIMNFWLSGGEYLPPTASSITGGNHIEWDWMEYYYTGGPGGGPSGTSNAIIWTPSGTKTGQNIGSNASWGVNPNWTFSPSSYHTLGFLETQDGSNMASCTYLNGVASTNCASSNSGFGFDPKAYLETGYIRINSSMSATPNPSHIRIKSIRVWSCPSYPAVCNGTLITTPPSNYTPP